MKKTFVTVALLLSPWAFSTSHAQEGDVPVEPRGSAGSVKALLYARPFTLQEQYRYESRLEKPEIASGYILVVEVEKEFARPREIGVPVLYVGNTPAELGNVGYESGRMIVIVPGEIDLATTPIFFGSEQLPERVDEARGNLEREAALAIGVVPFSESMVRQALAAGGERLSARDSVDLYLAIADLIDIYAPTESERASLYRIVPEGR